MDQKTKKAILKAQKTELTEYFVYKKLVKRVKDEENRAILIQVAEDEKKHHDIWEKYSGKKVKPNRFMLWVYYIVSRIFGLTFGLKLMERGERAAQLNYGKLSKEIPEAKEIEADENKHELKLLNLINEEKLKYAGSIVLGLNDALVELTGALAGITFALQDVDMVAVVGLITGIAAALSMAASEYLSIKTDDSTLKPLKASLYTGITYLITVLFLVFPYLILANPFVALAWTLINAILIILIFTFYISVTKDFSFKHRFAEMASISLGIAIISFGIGFLIRILFNIDI